MAIVTRYFSTTSAGAGDGTSWANRAELATAGNWSSIITGFDFSGSDALECYIGPGTYSITQDPATMYANPPTLANLVYFVACDSSGVEWTPPNPQWKCAQPIWDTTGMPILDFGSTGRLEGFFRAYGIVITVARNGAANAGGSFRWCHIINTNSTTGATGLSAVETVNNCVISMTGTAFATAFVGHCQECQNVRLEGNPAATTGTRRGMSFNTATPQGVNQLAFIGFPNEGYYNSGSANHQIQNVVAANCGDHGIELDDPANESIISRSVFVNNGGYGVTVGTTATHLIDGNLIRGNTLGGISKPDNCRDGNNYSAGSDAVDFVDAANGDYRIARTSAYWGLNIGAGDEPLDADEIAEYLWTNAGRTLT